MPDWGLGAGESQGLPTGAGASDRGGVLGAGWTFAIVLAAVLMVGAVLRFGALGLHSFWFDEVVAMRVARAPTLSGFAERLARMDMVGAPLHPLLLRYWTAAWGTSEAAARGLAASFSVLGLCAFAATAWQAFQSRANVLAATALLAVCPLDLTYAMENRMYSLLAFWTIVSWGLLFSFRRGRSLSRELGFGISLVGLAYTHPLGGLMILTLGLGYLIDARRSMLPPARWLAIQAMAFVAILPWVRRYMDHPPDPKLGSGLASVVFEWVAYGLGLPVWHLPLLLGVVALGWLYPVKSLRGKDGAERLGTGLMLCAWVALPLGLMTVYTWLCHPILGPLRYQVFLMPGVVLLIAGAIGGRPYTAGVVTAALVLGFTLPALRTEVYNEQKKPAWRAATLAMLRTSPNPIVVLAAREPHMYYQTVDYYLPTRVPVVSLQTYMQGLAGGTLDRGRDYWVFHDKLTDKSHAFFSTIPPSWRSFPRLDFGRLTATKLDATTLKRLGPMIP